MGEARRKTLQNREIGELWRRYKPLEGKDDTADLVIAMIRKLIAVGADAIPYGAWKDRVSHPLRSYGIAPEDWDGEHQQTNLDKSER
jgi:hypothetical protein